jgi:hypothetical protein
MYVIRPRQGLPGHWLTDRVSDRQLIVVAENSKKPMTQAHDY